MDASHVHSLRATWWFVGGTAARGQSRGKLSYPTEGLFVIQPTTDSSEQIPSYRQ